MQHNHLKNGKTKLNDGPRNTHTHTHITKTVHCTFALATWNEPTAVHLEIYLRTTTTPLTGHTTLTNNKKDNIAHQAKSHL
jgi:hypothetical protein